jgi:hypothetical protein
MQLISHLIFRIFVNKSGTGIPPDVHNLTGRIPFLDKATKILGFGKETSVFFG